MELPVFHLQFLKSSVSNPKTLEMAKVERSCTTIILQLVIVSLFGTLVLVGTTIDLGIPLDVEQYVEEIIHEFQL